MADTLTNNINIKLFSSANIEHDAFEKTLEKWAKSTKKSWFTNGYSWGIMGLITRIFFFSAVTFSVWTLTRGSISIGTLMLVIVYGGNLTEQLWGISNVFKRFSQLMSESAETLEILQTPHEITNLP